MSLETIPLVWIAGFSAFVAGLGIGFVITSAFGTRKKKLSTLHAELETAKTTHEAYQRSAEQHFQKTAELFEDLSRQHHSLHKHMTEGALFLGTTHSEPGIHALQDESIEITGDAADVSVDTAMAENEPEGKEEYAESPPLLQKEADDATDDTASSPPIEAELLRDTTSAPKERELH